MFRAGAALAVVCAVSQAFAGQLPRGHSFEVERPGAAPPGFEFAAMRQHTAGRWLIRREGTANALLHEADPSATGFSLALAPDTPLRDVEASVRVRLTGGTRAGGLVWRYTDTRHYYAAVLDLADGRLSLFRVSEGNRTFLESEDGLELDAGAWHTLKIVHDDSRIVVSLGGIRVLEERDRRYAQAGAGRTGLIAAGGAEAWFDDLRIERERGRR